MPADATSAAAVPHVPADRDAALIARLLAAMAEASATSPPELLDLAAVLRLTTQSKSSWYRAIAAGQAPASCSTPSGPRWKRKSVLAWIEKLRN